MGLTLLAKETLIVSGQSDTELTNSLSYVQFCKRAIKYSKAKTGKNLSSYQANFDLIIKRSIIRPTRNTLNLLHCK